MCTKLKSIALVILIGNVKFLSLVVIQLLSHVRLFETPWTVARKAPLSMGFPRQEY